MGTHLGVSRHTQAPARDALRGATKRVAERHRAVGAVALRHAAMPLALGDAVWAKYKLGEFFKIDDPQTKTPALRNPFANLKPGDLPLPEAAIEKLVARNVKFATCAMAIHHYSMRYAKEHGGEHEAIKKEWMAAVMPGIFVALSGVLAVHGAQSKGCTYCFAG